MALLIAIVAVSVGIAINWALRVPFFQNPDEAAHADYAFALYDAEALFSVPNAKAGSFVMPQTKYLARVAHYREFRYNTRAMPPHGFGTSAYLEAVDAGAPKPTGLIPTAGATVPYVMFSYPPLYYILVALSMIAASSLTHGSLVAVFFAARILSAVFLAGTLVLTFGIFRAVGQSRSTSLLATTAIGLLPLTSSVSASIQPDTFAALVVNVSLLLALRVRSSARPVFTIVLLTLSLTCLTFVKSQYALALCFVCIPMVLSRRGAMRYAAAFALPILGFLVAPRLSPVASVHLPALPLGEAHSLLHTLHLALMLGLAELRDIFFGGVVSEGFWMRFGFRAGSAYNGALRDVLVFVISTLSLMSIVLVLLREWLVLVALRRVWQKRAPARIARFLFAGVLLNTYVVTTALLLAVYVATSGELVLQGRYWFAILVPTVALTVVVAPRVLRAAQRRVASLVVAGMWAAYAIVSAPAAIAAREYDYYATGKGLPKTELGEVQSALDDQGRSYASSAIDVREGGSVTLAGYAIDAERGLPARRLIVEMPPGFRIKTIVGLRSYDVYRTFNDPLMMRTGFKIVLTVGHAKPGTYRGRILEIERRAPTGLPIADFALSVSPRAKR